MSVYPAKTRNLLICEIRVGIIGPMRIGEGIHCLTFGSYSFWLYADIFSAFCFVCYFVLFCLPRNLIQCWKKKESGKVCLGVDVQRDRKYLTPTYLTPTFIPSETYPVYYIIITAIWIHTAVSEINFIGRLVIIFYYSYQLLCS